MIRALVMVAVAFSLLAACDTPVSPERAYAQCSETGAAWRSVRGGRVEMGGRVRRAGAWRGRRDRFQRFPEGAAILRSSTITCFRNLTGAGPTRPLCPVISGPDPEVMTHG